jgi:hypothetical protein
LTKTARRGWSIAFRELVLAVSGYWTSGPTCALLERGVPWLAPDKLKAVRLLGQNPIDAVDSMEVARVYLASHVLLKQEGDPFQEIMNELSADEASVYAAFLQQRRYDALTPIDATAAREWLLDLVDRTTELLRQKADVFRGLAELDAAYAADRLSWDDTDEGERLRRYELTCKRTLLRMFELLLKVRRTGGAHRGARPSPQPPPQGEGASNMHLPRVCGRGACGLPGRCQKSPAV